MTARCRRHGLRALAKYAPTNGRGDAALACLALWTAALLGVAGCSDGAATHDASSSAPAGGASGSLNGAGGLVDSAGHPAAGASGATQSGGAAPLDPPAMPCVPASAADVRPGPVIASVITTADEMLLLAKGPSATFASGQCDPNGAVVLTVDSDTSYQTIQGFGAALTDSSARTLSTFDRFTDPKHALLKELFGPTEGLNLTFLHMDVGAGEFCSNGRSNYDPGGVNGTADPTLANFTMAGAEDHYTFNDLASIRAINPNLRLIVAPWSGPPWMKTNHSMVGGTLQPTQWGTMAQYMLKFIQAYQAAGNTIYAIAPQNQPETPGDANGFSFPSSSFTSIQEADFIANDLGPLLRASAPTVKIFTYEGDWNDPTYPLQVLSNPQARAFLSGTAFHCESGDSGAQDALRTSYPEQAVDVSRCGRTFATTFAQDLEWYAQNVMIGAIAHGAETVLLYNLALDQNNGRTNGGCTNCRGVVKIDLSVTPSPVSRNVEYYVLGQLSKYVLPGAKRVASTASSDASVAEIAFKNQDGTLVLFVLNARDDAAPLAVHWRSFMATYEIKAHSVATLVWPPTDK